MNEAYIFSTRDAYAIIYQVSSTEDQSPEVATCVLDLIWTSIRENEHIERDQAGVGSFQLAIEYLVNLGIKKKVAVEVCSRAIDDILSKIVVAVPDFSEAAYGGRYDLQTRGATNAVLTIRHDPIKPSGLL